MAQDIVLTINGNPVPCPSVMSWTVQTFDEGSGRSAGDGRMLRNVICHKEAIDLEFWCANFSSQEISQILQMLMPTFFTVGYFSPLSNSWVEKTMYVGDRQTNIIQIREGGEVIQNNLRFTLIER